MIYIKKRELFSFKRFNNLFTKRNDSQQNFVNNYCLLKTEDDVAEEMPIALIYNGISHAVMMCSPVNLKDFALGFSLTEGIIQHPKEIYGIDIENTCQGIEIHIELASRCFAHLKAKRRSLAGRTGCGICGTEQLKQVIQQPAVLPNTMLFDLLQLDQCLTEFTEKQALRQQTGASHASGFFTPDGELLAIREDIGRHIALDKLLGWHANAGKPQGFVLVSSRSSYEMVQKTATCGVEMLVSMSASTNLAIQLAESTNLTLIGFARPGRANIYTGEKRVFIR